MPKVGINAHIDEALKRALERHCQSRGVDMSDFIQEAIIDRLEELADVEDLTALRREHTRPLAKVLAELNLDG